MTSQSLGAFAITSSKSQRQYFLYSMVKSSSHITPTSSPDFKKACIALAESSKIIREIVNKYSPDMDSVAEFCDCLDNYSK